MTSTFRTLNTVAFLLALTLTAASIYFEFILGLTPCPLCIIQRLLVVLLAVTFFIGIFLKHKRGRRIQSSLVILFALTGILTAARQVTLQHLPPENLPSCGPDLAYMLSNLPFTTTLKLLLQGTGHCAEVQWQFLGFSMPTWTLLFFTLFLFTGLTQFIKAK